MTKIDSVLYTAFTGSRNAWTRIESAPELVINILCHLDRHEQIPMARVSKAVQPIVTELVWRCVDSRVFLFLTRGILWKKGISMQQDMVVSHTLSL